MPFVIVKMQYNGNPGIHPNLNRAETNTVNYPRLYNAYVKDSVFKPSSGKSSRKLREMTPDFREIPCILRANTGIFE